MAFIPSESPNITVKEFDLSGVVPAVQTSNGAFVGDFNWGPIDTPVLISNEAELVTTFGSPSLIQDSSVTDYLTAGSFLKYSSSMYVTRTQNDSAGVATAHNSRDSDSITELTVLNDDDWLTKKSAAIAGGHTFLAKHAGVVGNSLAVEVCGRGDSATVFGTWAYKGSFDARPGTSSYVASKSPDGILAYDEVHVAVVDKNGLFTGTPGTVVETYPFVSLATDAKTSDGTSNYVLDAINAKSEYIRAAQVPSEWRAHDSDATDMFTAALFGGTLSGTGVVTAVTETILKDGQNSIPSAPGNIATAYENAYGDEDTITVDFLIAPQMLTAVDQASVVNSLVALATARKDCVVVTSPNRTSVINNAPSAIVTDTVAFAELCTSSSYLIIDNNFVKVYDKYNDQYVYIPAAASTAGVMALTDDTSAPWFSPAGSRRGQYLGVTSLAYSPTKAQRDTLYKSGVNPIVNIPGQGILLYGDKTKLGRPSAFDRINVRRLFIGIERAIKGAAQNVMFEFNDEFTRAEFVNIIEPFLREIKGRRGITDFRVVCDETNNTAAVIDSNQFIASVFIKPARSINYVTLNFVAVRTGVDFDEVVGLV
jgi:phage tail sheath protein FI